MPTLQIIALAHDSGGPDLPTAHGAWVGWRDWPGEGRTPILRLQLGDTSVEIWPADADEVEALGKQLLILAEQLRLMS